MASTQSSQSAFNKVTACTINSIHTDFVCHKFANKHLILVTQYEKIGNIFVASNEIAFSGIINSQSLCVNHKFGKTTDEIECAIQYLLSNLQLGSGGKDLDIVICLTLKEYSRAILTEIGKFLASIMK